MSAQRLGTPGQKVDMAAVSQSNEYPSAGGELEHFRSLDLTRPVSEESAKKAADLIREISEDLAMDADITIDNRTYRAPVFDVYRFVGMSVTWRHFRITDPIGEQLPNMATDGKSVYICLDFVANFYDVAYSHAYSRFKDHGHDVAHDYAHRNAKLAVMFGIIHELVHVMRMHTLRGYFIDKNAIDLALKAYPYNIPDFLIYDRAFNAACEDATNAETVRILATALAIQRGAGFPWLTASLPTLADRAFENPEQASAWLRRNHHIPDSPPGIDRNVWYFYAAPNLFSSQESRDGDSTDAIPTVRSTFENFMPVILEVFEKHLPIMDKNVIDREVVLNENDLLPIRLQEAKEHFSAISTTFFGTIAMSCANIVNMARVAANRSEFGDFSSIVLDALNETKDRCSRYITDQTTRQDLLSQIDDALRAWQSASGTDNVPDSVLLLPLTGNGAAGNVIATAIKVREHYDLIVELLSGIRREDVFKDGDPVINIGIVFDRLSQHLRRVRLLSPDESLFDALANQCKNFHDLVTASKNDSNAPHLGIST